MRTKCLSLCFFSLLILGVAETARAQEPEVGISYSYARITNGDGLNLPAGFLVSVAGGGRTSPWLVGEVGGNFRSGEGDLKLFTIQGGVRFFTDLDGGVRPFAQLLIGLGSLHAGGGSANKFSVEPAAGVDLPLAEGVAFRAGVGFPVLITEGENLKVFRFNLGIVLGGR